MRLLLRIIIVAATAALLAAQTTAVLRGRVLDPSGAVIPGAVLTLAGPNGLTRTLSSDANGAFTLTGVPSGTYTLRVAAPGFAAFDGPVELGAGRVNTMDVHLTIALDRQEVAVAGQAQVQTDPASNATAVVVDGAQLGILADNPDDLENDLLMLAGPAAGPNGGQIFIDGFSNGQLPTRESIREIRVNSDPFSAQYDRVGFGRVEVLTKPGTERFHGATAFTFSDSNLNSRNPYSITRPATQMRQYQVELSGSVNRRTSFNVEGTHANQDQTSLINAVVLDADLQPVRYSANIPAPNARTYFSPRVDYSLNPKTTLEARYTVSRTTSENNGVGNFSLPSRAISSENTQQIMQLNGTAVLSPRWVNETRFQYRRSRTHQQAADFGPQILVLDAFTGGGAALGLAYYHSDNFEYHNYTSYTRGAHLVRFGMRLRHTIENGYSTANYNGVFTFTSIDSYVATLRGLPGSGPSQYSVTGGNPLLGIMQIDASPFVQDDWKAAPNITLSMGLRYEIQNNISDRRAWAPRLGLAWGIGGVRGRAAQAKTVLRVGGGLFYDRFSEGTSLLARRQNGINQQQFVILYPSFFPVAPSIGQLLSQQPQTIRVVDTHLEAPLTIQGAAGIEHQLPKNVTIAVNYTRSRGLHQVRTRNINAPLSGTYHGPGTGVFPYGFEAGSRFLYESSATFHQTQLAVNVNARVSPKLSLFSNYTWGRAYSNADGVSSNPGDPYNTAADWSRAGFDIRHRLQLGGTVTAPLALQFNPQVVVSSEPPFNIVIGRDINGDLLFNERPAFATDLTRPSVRVTPWGNFDADPLPGQTLIPRNYGTGYASVQINLRLGRTWSFGESTRGAGRGRGAARYTVTLSAQARNILNHTNPGLPIGNMSSPLFGAVTNMHSVPNPTQNANRRLEMQLRFGF